VDQKKSGGKLGKMTTAGAGGDVDQTEKEKSTTSRVSGNSTTAAKDAAAFKRWASAASNLQISEAVDELRKQRDRFEPASYYQVFVDGLLKKAADMEAAANMRPTFVRIGETILEKGINLFDLMHDWDPNAKGKMSKMEFRQHMRKFLTINPPETVEIDELFLIMDESGNGYLETDEIKKAFFKFTGAAKSFAINVAEAYKATEALRQKAQLVARVVEHTENAEQANADLEAGRIGSIKAILGDKMISKGLKEADLALRWSGKSGEISQADFRREVIALIGPTAIPEEVDALFAELDRDGGGSLGRDELKEALIFLKREAEAKKLAVRELGLQYIQLFKKMKVAQAEFAKDQKVEDDAAKEEAKREAQEAQERAAAEAEAKQARAAAKAEKLATKEAEEQAMADKILAKRRGLSGSLS
jgi:Ca2+-binding EF-hand superfamily protein